MFIRHSAVEHRRVKNHRVSKVLCVLVRLSERQVELKSDVWTVRVGSRARPAAAGL